MVVMRILVDEVVKDLLKIVENNSTFRGTGDTMVFGFAFDEDQDGELDEINVFVCRNYEEAEAWLSKDCKTFEKMDWERDYEREEYEAEIAKLEGNSKEELIKMVINSKYKDF